MWHMSRDDSSVVWEKETLLAHLLDVVTCTAVSSVFRIENSIVHTLEQVAYIILTVHSLVPFQIDNVGNLVCCLCSGRPECESVI